MSHKLKTIPLCQLRPSKANIRKTDRLAGVSAMADNIAEKDLLENLVVQRALQRNGHDPIYDVVAGGRRYAALKLLAKRRKISRDHPVRCLLLDKEESATEVSLAENMLRIPLHPADQFEAFAALAHEGLPVDEMAARFGVTPAFVEQRLKLATVSPRLIAEYRGGAMTLEQLTAFTLSNSQALQEEVWFERAYADLPAQLIRSLLTKAQVAGDDPRARFIGAKAYEAAGGVLIRDLFDAEDEGYYADSQLLDRLVAERLEQAVQSVRDENWQWVEIHPSADLVAFSRYGRADIAEQPLGKADETRLAKLSDRYDELADAAEDGDDRVQAELERVGREIDILQAKKTIWTEEEKNRAGVIVYLNQDGETEIVRGLLKPDANGSGHTRTQPAKDRKKVGNGYSEGVLADLAAHRTAALRAVLAQKPDIAFRALLHGLVNQLFYQSSALSCLCIRASEVLVSHVSATVGDSKATQAFAALHQAWQERLPKEDDLWPFLERLDQEDSRGLLAHCVALTVNALHGRAGAHEEHVAALARDLGLDMRMWWSPTRGNFLDRITKNDILAAVSEGVSQQSSWRLAGLKKERMAKEAEKLLASSEWVPEPFRLFQSCAQKVT